MSQDNLFHRGIASGDGFCNRTEETSRLLKNTKEVTHTLLTSPRRYGKTSLALHAIELSKLPYAHIDLFMKYNTEDILDEFYQNIGKLISKILPITAKTIHMIQSFFKNITLSLTVKKIGFEVTITHKSTETKKNLKNFLIDFEAFLTKQEKSAIIFIDEMQAITESPFCEELEAILRFVAQKTKNIIFIFSGSNRHMLSKIFDDRSRPLYKLCHRMIIQRISKEHYIKFINAWALKQWKKPIEAETFYAIFYYTQCHPYYLNILCRYLFEKIQVPAKEDVENQWKIVCREEQSSLGKDIELLTSKQKHLLNEIAKHPNLKEPTAKDFLKKVELTPKGILGAIQILLKHDLIEKRESGEYCVIDPVLAYWAKGGETFTNNQTIEI
jgi:AAA+ ATPase superfamily predicted ATPase